MKKIWISKWFWIAAIVLAVVSVWGLKYLATEWFYPVPEGESGSIHFEDAARSDISKPVFNATARDAKTYVEAAFGAFERPLFYWLSHDIVRVVKKNDREITAHPVGEIVIGETPGAPITVRVNATKANRETMIRILAHARVLEKEGKPGTFPLLGEATKVDGVASFLFDPDGKYFGPICESAVGSGRYDSVSGVLKEERDNYLRWGWWLKVAYLSHVKGWSTPKIVGASEAEIYKDLPSDGSYQSESLWKELKPKLPKK